MSRDRHSYDNPLVITYPMGFHDFGAGAGALAIRRPAGYKRARVLDIHVAVKETFTQTTTPGFVRVGTAGDPDKYAELNMGAAANTDGYNMSNTGVKGAMIDLETDAISQLEVAFVAPTGGTPAGQGEVAIVVAWY